MYTKKKIKKILRKKIKFVGFAALFILIGALICAIASYTVTDIYILALPELLPMNYKQVTVTADVANDMGIVTLTSGCKQIIAYTEPEQARSIAAGIAGYIGRRPNTHDLIVDTFESLGIKVHMLKIVEIRNNTFIGRLILQQGKRIVSLDSRPSDGTAIAVRVGAPIYINPQLLEEYGKNIC